MAKNNLKSIIDEINEKYKIRLGGIIILFMLIIACAAFLTLIASSVAKTDSQIKESMDLYGFNRELDVFFTNIDVDKAAKGEPYSVIVLTKSGIYKDKPVNILLYDKYGNPYDIVITPSDVDPEKKDDNTFIMLNVSEQLVAGELQDFIKKNDIRIDLTVHPATYQTLYP